MSNIANVLIEIGRVMDNWQYEIYQQAKEGFDEKQKLVLDILEKHTTEHPEDMEVTAEISKAFNKMGEQLMGMFALAMTKRGPSIELIGGDDDE